MSARIVIKLNRHTRRRFQRMARKCSDANTRTRIQIVLLYAQGKGAVQISRSLSCSQSLATRVARRYREMGEKAFEDGRQDNGQAKIDEDLLQALHELLENTPEDYHWSRTNWTQELLAIVLLEETGVEVSGSTIARMLVMLGARWGMPKPVVFCPWPEAQKKSRIRQILRVVENLPADEVAYYEDEVDIHLNPKIGRDWMLPCSQKQVLTPGKNKKNYVAGALAVDGSDLVFVASDRKRSALFIELLEALRKKHPRARRIHLVLDNVTIHSSQIVKKYLREFEGLFELHFLPPYCPDHNRIERFWRELHANVTRNHRCKNIAELMSRVRKYLQEEARRRRQMAKSARHAPCSIEAA